MSNRNMNKARVNQNDEFYTLLRDIEDELRFYRPHFEDKIVYLNTDHPDYSNFYWHFKMLFEVYKLKKLVATFWDPEGKAFKTEYDGNEEIRTPLKGDGDFRSDECLAILEESDIVVTNPPFSLFREFINTLITYDKKFLIIGNSNAVTYKDIFPLILKDKLWYGVNQKKMDFLIPSNSPKNAKQWRDSDGNRYQTFGNIVWYTNLDYPKRYDDLLLWSSYKGSEDFYPEYDNYKAINVDAIKYIPYDYKGVMGVPISFIGKWNPNQFEIIGVSDRGGDGYIEHLKKEHDVYNSPIVKGEKKYTRIFIRNLNPIDEIKI